MPIQAVKPATQINFDGVSILTFAANKGFGLPRHEHIYAHLTYCHCGSVIVRKEGKEIVVTPRMPPLYLVANEWHEIEALEDSTVFQNIFRDEAN